MSMKFVIAKTGFDAGTTTNPNNLTFSSDYNTLKYATSGTYTMVNVGTPTIVTLPHNLGYTPFFTVFVNDPVNASSSFGMVEYINNFGTNHFGLDAYIDSTNLYLDASGNFGTPTYGGPYTITWYYKIFKNNLGL